MQIKLRLYLILFAFILFLIDSAFALNNSTQISFLIVVLILFGVPHGALDLYIDQYLHKSESNQKIFLLKYIANIIGYALVWYFFPVAALIIFILITAYHFGEIDWLGKTEKLVHKIAYSIIGLLWILLLLSKNINFALQIFIRMDRSAFNENQLIALAHKIYPLTLDGLVVMYLILFFFKEHFFSKSTYYYYSIIQQLTLIIFAFYMPLWLCFAFYFGFWHSLLSFDKIRITFSMPNDFHGWKSLLVKAAPFSIMAWFGFIYITFLTLNSKDASGIFTLLFISLSVLALPHLQIFTKIKLKSD
ncbi:MAG: Brp/Blh family beta-carotene 15,15'-dioxygenase [Chitinophagia bacterium]|jgi:Brp/Blh family beta-carotene 15,15'-monooxygenase